DRLRAVGEHQRHPVALADSQARQRAGEAVHLPLQVPVKQRPPEKQGGRMLGKLDCRVLQEPVEGYVRIIQRGLHGALVEAYPRALVVRRGPGHGAPPRDADPGVPHPEAVNQPFGWYVPERDAESLPPAGSGKRQATATLRRTLSRAVL